MVQAGHVSLPHRGEPQVAPDMNERYLVNMGTEFLVRVLEYADGRHSEVYAIRPEISRQRYPLHPHLRDDRSALLGGRCLQALCTDFAPDKACSSLVDVLDFAAIFLAKHLVWVRTRYYVDRLRGRVLFIPAPREPLTDFPEIYRGPEYNIHAARLLRSFPYPFQERFGWEGFWPGPAAPHGFASNLGLPACGPCHCGSGRCYAECHRSWDGENLSHLLAAMLVSGPKRAA